MALDSLKIIKLLNRFKIFNPARDFYYKFKGEHKKSLPFYRQFLSDGDLCFDAGTNIGQKTDIFLSLGCSVIAVEPQKDCAKYLKNKYRNKKNVHVVAKALDKGIGFQNMYICEANALSTMSTSWINENKLHGRYTDFTWQKTDAIPTTTLDQLIQEFGKPKFCKIDVEGFELSVVQGLTERIPYISLEISPENQKDIHQAIQYLKGIGHIELNHCSWDKYSFTFLKWIKDEEVMWKNINAMEPNNSTGDIYIHFT